MESIIKDEKGAEPEADLGDLRHETVVDSELPPTWETLTIINSGTRASHRSHDESPTNTQAMDTSSGESSRAVLQTTADHRRVDSETRALKEPETSSDDTDEWETASEKSLALELESHDPYRVREETGQEKHNEDAGTRGPKTISEETGLHETMSDNAGPHIQETVSEDAVSHGQEMVIEDAGPHSHETLSEKTDPLGQKTVSKDAESHDHEPVGENAQHHETLGEEAELHSLETVSKDAKPHDREIVYDSRETVSKDARLHDVETVYDSQETVGKDAGIHDQETVHDSRETVSKDDQKTVYEVDELHGLKSVSEETVPFGLEMSGKEAELSESHGDLETDNYDQETVSEEARHHGQEMVSGATGSSKETVGSIAHETVSNWTNPDEETVGELVRSLGNETVSDVTVSDVSRPHGSHTDAELQDNETVGGIGSEEFHEDSKISLYPDNTSAVSDRTLKDILVTMNKETTDYNETSSPEGRDENKSDSEEIQETVGHGIKSDPTYDVRKETFSGGTDGGHFLTQYIYIETVNEDDPNVTKETFHGETQVVDAERDDAEKEDVYKGIDGHELQGSYKQTDEESLLRESPDTEDLELGDAGMLETSERMEEVLSEEGIVIEACIEEGEMAEKQVQMKSIEDHEQNDDFLEASRVLDEGATNEDELVDNDDSKQKWDLSETSSKSALTEEIRITKLECERLEEKLHSIKTLVGTDEGLSEELPNIVNQETVLEFPYSTPVTTDEESYIGCIMDLETQLAVSGPPTMEEKEHLDHAKTLSDIETKSIEPEYIRLIDTQNEPFDTLGLGYNADLEVQVVSSEGQGIGEPCLQSSGLHTEGDTLSKDDSSTGLQNQRFSDPETLQEEATAVQIVDLHSSPYFSWVDQSAEEVPQDEPDHYKLQFFPITLKGIGIVSALRELGPKSTAQDLLPESIDTECVTGEESTQESVRQESTLGDIHLAIGFDQDSMAPGSETAKTTATNLENIKLLRRQRSNTDPGLGLDQEKLQTSSDSESSSRARVRSITPPCDKFTSSYSTTSPKTLEQPPTSVLFPMMDVNKNSHREKDTSAKEHTFYPTQIFNPMLLLSNTQEEFGFYQTETFRQGVIGNASQRPLPSPPQDNRVHRYTQNPEIIVIEPKSLPKSTEGTSNIIKPMLTPSVAPVWLPPQRTRYVGDSGGVNETRPAKTPENHLVRRATIRHKRSNVGAKPTAKRFSNASLPVIPQKDYLAGPGTSNLPKIQSVNVSKIQISSKNRHVPQKQVISEETGQSRSSSSMETVREEGHPDVKEKPSNSPESILMRGSCSKKKPPPPSDPSHSIHRRYSTFINSSNLLYQEYSDVALNQEIQRQKPGDSPAEDSLPSSPRVRRRILSSQDSYLQRLSISSADSLWQDIPKIRDSVTFLSMTREEQKLQEAKFELIMSEALYLRSLNIAVDHFQRSAELQEVLSAQDRQWLFSRLSEVRDASSDFLFDLEEEFESNMYKFQVCEVVIGHEATFRRVYLPYVTNQTYQDRTFQRLMNDNPRFQQVLARLESDPVCQRLSLKSFLILPFQRITRMRLLLQNILKRSSPGSGEELQATEAHNAVEKLIRDCNDGVQRMRDTEELILLNQRIQFECKIFPLISQSRRLVKHGEVTSLEFNSMSFKWKVTTRPVYLHLFNDCLLLSRVREGGRFVVFDHSSDVRVERCEIKLHTNQKNIFRVFLRDSAAMGREAEYIFRTETQSQKLRWICALSPPKEEIDFWKDHGLSQMQCLKSYKARENDELSLEKADILMITQNSDDGWLHGIRLSDQHSGWFPQPNVQNISRNACLRNLQEEQRLQTARAKLQPTGAKEH